MLPLWTVAALVWWRRCGRRCRRRRRGICTRRLRIFWGIVRVWRWPLWIRTRWCRLRWSRRSTSTTAPHTLPTAGLFPHTVILILDASRIGNRNHAVLPSGKVITAIERWRVGRCTELASRLAIRRTACFTTDAIYSMLIGLALRNTHTIDFLHSVRAIGRRRIGNTSVALFMKTSVAGACASAVIGGVLRAGKNGARRQRARSKTVLHIAVRVSYAINRTSRFCRVARSNDHGVIAGRVCLTIVLVRIASLLFRGEILT